jgi:hypothetical protein
MPIARFLSGPKTKRLAKERFMRLLWEWMGEQGHEDFLEDARRLVPGAWHFVEMDIDTEEPKDKVTLYLDRSVAKVFRAMGAGYQARINRILATWLQMKMAEMKALEMKHLEALEATMEERDGPDPKDISDRRTNTLAEHWAYWQGVKDAAPRDGGE